MDMQRLSISRKKLQAQPRIRLWHPCKESLAGVHLSTAPEASAGNAPALMCLLHSRYTPFILACYQLTPWLVLPFIVLVTSNS